MELLGEYVGLEGQRQQLRVPCEAPGVTDPFQSLLSGVAQMRDVLDRHQTITTAGFSCGRAAVGTDLV